MTFPLIFFPIALLSVEVSHYATVDTLLVFFVTLSLFLILRAQEKDNILAYIWAAFACGVTGSVKYPGILTFFPLLLVLVENRRFTWIPFIFFTCLFSFFLVSPFILIDFSSFRRCLLKLLQFSYQNIRPVLLYDTQIVSEYRGALILSETLTLLRTPALTRPGI